LPGRCGSAEFNLPINPIHLTTPLIFQEKYRQELLGIIMSENHKGSCLCGKVTFEVHGALREIVFCHCGQCRKQTGLYYASTSAADEDLVIEGADNITWYHSSEKGRRGFCKHCGSALFWKYEGGDGTSIQAGSMDMPSKLVPGHHIFCEDKGDFYEIQDGLPQFRKDSPGLLTNSE
jgi:hypothetical protein